jgi:hypothetical protein
MGTAENTARTASRGGRATARGTAGVTGGRRTGRGMGGLGTAGRGTSTGRGHGKATTGRGHGKATTGRGYGKATTGRAGRGRATPASSGLSGLLGGLLRRR